MKRRVLGWRELQLILLARQHGAPLHCALRKMAYPTVFSPSTNAALLTIVIGIRFCHQVQSNNPGTSAV